MQVEQGKYGATKDVYFELYEVDGVDLRTDWTPAAADCQVSVDGGAYSNSDNIAVVAPTGSGTYKVVLSITEMTGKVALIKLVDAATKVFLDKVIKVETYGHASAMHAFDLDAASVAQSADNDTKLTTIAGDVANIDGDAMRGTNSAATEAKQDIIDTVVNANKTAIDHATYGLSAIRTRGDAAWITGGGGSITDMLHIHPLIPSTIDLADTATIRIGIGLSNMLDDLPSTAEITPGTITIDRKAVGGTSWTNVVNAAACSEATGLIYYDEVFDNATGYRPGDSIRITFKGQKIVVAANDYEITPTDGWMFYTYIRGAERSDVTNAIHTYTVLDADDNGIQDVLVEAKLTGTTILVQTARTNSSGISTFYLSAGTYDFYATKAGYSFTNPDTETVS